MEYEYLRGIQAADGIKVVSQLILKWEDFSDLFRQPQWNHKSPFRGRGKQKRKNSRDSEENPQPCWFEERMRQKAKEGQQSLEGSLELEESKKMNYFVELPWSF